MDFKLLLKFAFVSHLSLGIAFASSQNPLESSDDSGEKQTSSSSAGVVPVTTSSDSVVISDSIIDDGDKATPVTATSLDSDEYASDDTSKGKASAEPNGFLHEMDILRDAKLPLGSTSTHNCYLEQDVFSLVFNPTDPFGGAGAAVFKMDGAELRYGMDLVKVCHESGNDDSLLSVNQYVNELKRPNILIPYSNTMSDNLPCGALVSSLGNLVISLPEHHIKFGMLRLNTFVEFQAPFEYRDPKKVYAVRIYPSSKDLITIVSGHIFFGGPEDKPHMDLEMTNVSAVEFLFAPKSHGEYNKIEGLIGDIGSLFVRVGSGESHSGANNGAASSSDVSFLSTADDHVPFAAGEVKQTTSSSDAGDKVDDTQVDDETKNETPVLDTDE